MTGNPWTERSARPWRELRVLAGLLVGVAGLLVGVLWSGSVVVDVL